jgi:RNA polymerase sigma-54 factor
MALELRQNLKLQQQLIMTPQLQQALKLLQMPRLELAEAIQIELRENPTLEEVLEPLDEDKPILEDEHTYFFKGPGMEKGIRAEEILWDSSPYEYGPIDYSQYQDEDSRPTLEQSLTRHPSLIDHLIWQMRLSEFTEEQRRIGLILIGNVDDDGYLRISLDDVSKITASPLEVVEMVLKRIQEFDPPGVCARDLPECLLIQARQLGINSSLVEEIILHHFEDLKNQNYTNIAKLLGISVKEVIEVAECISKLEPKPGRAFSTEEPHYIIPDVFVYRIDNEYVIFLNEDGLPKLRISPFYRSCISSGSITKEEREYIQEKIRSALWLIKSIHQRQRTIYRVTESIMKFQREFLDKGVSHLKPLVLRDVAQDIGMSESTISRVVTNKYVQTPQGIFELRYFFNSGIQKNDGDSIASESIKEMIKKLIQNEDPSRPLSDSEIVNLLLKNNIPIARRTVAKYRTMAGIPPSNKRKRAFEIQIRKGD